MQTEIKHLENKIDNGFNNLNTKFDKHEGWEAHLLEIQSKNIQDIYHNIQRLSKEVFDIQVQHEIHKRKHSNHEGNISKLWLISSLILATLISLITKLLF